jgi:hypothetical protein
MMHVYLFASSEPVLIVVVDFSSPQGNDSRDSLHLREGERSSSLSIEFEPLPTDLYDVAFDHDREMILSFRDKSLEIENSWAMECFEIPATLEFIGKGSIDEHGRFILDIFYGPCSHNSSLESAMPSALSTHEGYNHLLVLYSKLFRRLIVDAYVYHKHIRFHLCIVALTLQLSFTDTSKIGSETGMTPPMIAASTTRR